MTFVSFITATKPSAHDQVPGVIHGEQQAEHLFVKLRQVLCCAFQQLNHPNMIMYLAQFFVLCVVASEPSKHDQVLGLILREQ